MSLSDSPREIVLDIADHLHYEGVNALCRTNSQLYRLLNRYLYRRDITQSEGRSLRWAAERADRLRIRESTSTAQWGLDACRHLNRIPDCCHLALQIAAVHGHWPLVELLLKIDGINPSFDKYCSTPVITLAVKGGQDTLIEMLLATANIDPNVRDYIDINLYGSPLLHACKLRHVSIVKQLLARDDVDVNAFGFSLFETPLLITCGSEGFISPKSKHDGEIADLLLDKAGINVNFPNIRGDTPLMLAVRHQKMSVVRSLLAKSDLDPNILNSKGDHVLGCSAYKGDITTVKLLLGHPHIDLNLVAKGGRSALMLACMAGNPDMVKLLLSREDIAINQRDTDGLTALCHATETGYSHAYMTGGQVQATRLLDLLLEKDGIDPNTRDNDGRTPLARICLRPAIHFDRLFNAFALRQFGVIVRSLLSHRSIDPNAVDNKDVSILADVINKLIRTHRTRGREHYGDYGKEIESLLRAAGARLKKSEELRLKKSEELEIRGWGWSLRKREKRKAERKARERLGGQHGQNPVKESYVPKVTDVAEPDGQL